MAEVESVTAGLSFRVIFWEPTFVSHSDESDFWLHVIIQLF